MRSSVYTLPYDITLAGGRSERQLINTRRQVGRTKLHLHPADATLKEGWEIAPWAGPHALTHSSCPPPPALHCVSHHMPLEPAGHTGQLQAGHSDVFLHPFQTLSSPSSAPPQGYVCVCVILYLISRCLKDSGGFSPYPVPDRPQSPSPHTSGEAMETREHPLWGENAAEGPGGE